MIRDTEGILFYKIKQCTLGTISTKVFLLDVGNFFEINDKELLAVETLVELPTLYYKQKFTVRIVR